MLTCPELVRALRWSVHTTHEVGFHNIVLVGHTPVLDREVTPAVHLLKHGVLESLVKSLNVTYRVVLKWDTWLQLNRWLT